MNRMLGTVFFVIALAGMMCGCSDKPFTIYNACYGTWAEVYDGAGHLLVARLEYGVPASPDLRGYAGTRIEFLAILHELTGNRVVGHAQTDRTLPRGRNGGNNGFNVVGPDQLEPWDINRVSDSNWDCRVR